MSHILEKYLHLFCAQKSVNTFFSKTNSLNACTDECSFARDGICNVHMMKIKMIQMIIFFVVSLFFVTIHDCSFNVLPIFCVQFMNVIIFIFLIIKLLLLLYA
jgi:hypothetical protein